MNQSKADREHIHTTAVVVPSKEGFPQAPVDEVVAQGLREEPQRRDLHHIQNLLAKLTSEARGTPTAGALSFRDFIRQTAVPGARPLALVVHEVAALVEALPTDQQGPALELFLDVHRQLADPAIAPMKVLEATAQVTVKAFSQFVQHENAE